MTAHRNHPIIDPQRAYEQGLSSPDDPASVLYEECERCLQHAQRPFVGLDHGNLSALILAATSPDVDTKPLTTPEQIAIGHIKEHIDIARTIAQLQPRALFGESGRTPII